METVWTAAPTAGGDRETQHTDTHRHRGTQTDKQAEATNCDQSEIYIHNCSLIVLDRHTKTYILCLTPHFLTVIKCTHKGVVIALHVYEA